MALSNLIGLALAGLALAPPPTQESDVLTRRLDHHAELARKSTGLRGLTLGIEFGGDVVGTWGYGLAAAPDARALPAGGAFDLLTIAAALAAAHDEELELDAGLDGLVPELGELATGRTVLQLLQHSTGLPDYGDLIDGEPGEVAAMVAALADQAAVSDPGHCFGWTPSDTLVLGLLLERSSEQGLRQVLLESVFAPLDLRGTWPDEARQRGDGWITTGIDSGATSSADARAADPWNAADLRLDPEQLLTLWAGFRDGDLFGPGLARRAFTSFEEGHGRGGDHGLAVHRASLGELEGWIAGGRLGDDHVSFAWYPEIELSIVASANGADADLPALVRAAARAVLDLPEPATIDLPLDAERATAYVGGYSIGCNNVLISMGDDGHLSMTRETESVALAYQGGNVFSALDDPDLRLRFDAPVEGNSPGFVLDDHGSQVVATRFD
ncbi:serine hydrolase domain-containing protein [Engelhardtia mirabilis]|uniref:Beta-lactamase n=1 Tax=Engelhardtia mirabilis TaxID=2528011 RepID=A0A518BDB4_9BACT|nr:Beta-lactamase [Planctomycetes bacterium Pla133]QDU99303.1 Beta-lactamase [Planctomycetes bacterium Pla86]